jgi:dTDP-glucose 4,6-dehydratase/UDP-glucuronate decarboxylase
MYSEGKDTRSFCYVSDAIEGFFKVFLSDFNGEAFNVGSDAQEISMRNLAQVIKDLFDNKIEIVHKENPDRNYLLDNPRRRCPDLTKIKNLLKYDPQVDLKTGLQRLIEWYRL